jgi:predicted membrane protein
MFVLVLFLHLSQRCASSELLLLALVYYFHFFFLSSFSSLACAFFCMLVLIFIVLVKNIYNENHIKKCYYEFIDLTKSLFLDCLISSLEEIKSTK